MLFAGWEVRIVKNCDRGLELEKDSRKRYCDRGQNPDRAKNQSDCRIRYRARLEKK